MVRVQSPELEIIHCQDSFRLILPFVENDLPFFRIESFAVEVLKHIRLKVADLDRSAMVSENEYPVRSVSVILEHADHLILAIVVEVLEIDVPFIAES